MTRTVSFNDAKDDLFYELRMLFGANLMVQHADEQELGNVINYFKDSAYVHIRNLYEFFTKASGGNDIHLEDFDVSRFHSLLYSQWEESLNRRVMHLSPGRLRRNTIKEPLNSTQLNQMIPRFVNELQKFWEDWASVADSATGKTLRELLTEAKQQAQADYNNMVKKIGDKK